MSLCVLCFFFIMYCDYFVIVLALVHEFRMQHQHNHNIFAVFIGLVWRVFHTFIVTQQAIDVFTAVNSFYLTDGYWLYNYLEHRIKFTNKWICPLSTSYSEIYARTHTHTILFRFLDLYSKCSHQMNWHEFLFSIELKYVGPHTNHT